MDARRLWAIAALVLAGISLVLAVGLVVARFPRGLSVLACLVLAALSGWHGIRHRGTVRIVGMVAAALLVAVSIVLIVVEGTPLLNVVVAVAFVLALAVAPRAFKVHVHLPRADPPAHAVLVYNPKSGGGKAEKFHLADEARRRGIEPIELSLGDDLEKLIRDAVTRGADGLAAAGGDGTQAIVAMVAAEHNLPYACIPAGTRNHFALDLGVDRNDVVGALDAFVNGGERTVDLAEVNGRVFVNNVSLGLYAEAVQRAGYREAKIRTLLDTVPDMVGPAAKPLALSAGDEAGQHSALAILISNNSYRLGSALSSGTRPRLDQGTLGIALIGATNGGGESPPSGASSLRQWTAPSIEIGAPQPVPAGIDGEAATLDPPLRFEVRPGALRVRIAPQHPGASPSAIEPETTWQTVVALGRLALTGHLPLAPAASGEQDAARALSASE
jgi:diacylglycerol kinase family enzyme